MTIRERDLPQENHVLQKERKQTYGLGLLKGLGVTLKHLFKRNTVIQYPDEKQDLPARTRGVIALKEENCTVCMLCGRECPDWCIYIDSHKETLPPKREGGRPRKRNVLDRFAIDYALCMYCGICVEVCPYDALFWSREFEYAEYDIRELTHEKERLSDWMATVLPPPELEEGAQIAGQPEAPPATATAPAAGARPATTTSSAVEERADQAAAAPKAGSAAAQAAQPVETLPKEQQRPETATVAEPRPAAMPQETVERGEPGMPAEGERTEHPTEAAVEQTTPEKATEKREEAAPAAPAGNGAVAVDAAEAPAAEPARETPSGAPPEGPEAVAPARPPAAPEEDPQAVYEKTLQDQVDKGSSPQVAEARAKVARVKAERGLRKAGTTPAPAVEPSAPEAGVPQDPTPPGAPSAEAIEPEPGPVAPTAGETQTEAEAPAEAETPPEPEAAAKSEAPAKPETQPEPDAAAEPEAAAPAKSQAPPAPQAPQEAEDPEAIYERVLAEQRELGVSDAVAVARAKAARIRAQKGTKGPGN